MAESSSTANLQNTHTTSAWTDTEAVKSLCDLLNNAKSSKDMTAFVTCKENFVQALSHK